MDEKIQYLPLDEEGLVCSETDPFLQYETPERRRRARLGFDENGQITDSMIWTCHGVLLSISGILFFLSMCSRYGISYDQYQARHFSPYSPAAPVVEYESVRYNVGAFNDGSEYVGYGPDVDRAWRQITTDVGDQVITRAELDRLGLDPLSVQLADPVTGKDGYRAGLQVFHQLECLNLLRQDSFRDYYSHHSDDFRGSRQVLRRHLDHCLETLRMSLMCQSDVGVFTYKQHEGIDGQWPDLNTLHTCRNFDAIRNWASENAVTST